MPIPAIPDGFFHEGWDKYGEPTPSNLITLLLMGEWNLHSLSGTGSTTALRSPLSGDGAGYALRMNCSILSSTFNVFTRLLGANYARICGGITFRWENNTSTFGIIYSDAGTPQFAVAINSDGTFSLKRGNERGTTLVTTLDAPSIGTTNCLEWDIAMLSTTTCDATFYLNGVPTTIENFNGDICATATAQFSRVGIGYSASSPGASAASMDVDHFYNNFYIDPLEAGAGCLLGNPVIDTDYPLTDFDLDFDKVVGLLGYATRYGSNVATPAANSLILEKVTAVGDATLRTMNLAPNATSATAKFKGVIYADDGTGLAPAALLDTGAEVVGCTSGIVLSSDMSDIAIVDGTQYWIGFIMDTALSMQLRDGNLQGYRAARTYTLGAPNPAPAMTIGQGTWYMNGVLDPAEGWSQLRQNPPVSGSYNQGDTAGERFMHGFDPLTVNPLEIYCVAVKPNLRRTDAGARTISVIVESDGSETVTPAVAPSTSGEWIAGYYPVDPDTGIEWSAAGVNSLNGGGEIIT